MNPLYTAGDKNRYIKTDKSDCAWRSEYRRDYARVIHSPSFRRLQGKTQLFPGHESDFFRNRLTHSLEVAQIAESIASKLNYESDYFKNYNIEEQICVTAALLHDLGHPPFGHNGEEALDRKMHKWGGFEGNAQTLRIVSQIEKKRRVNGGGALASRAGLNLTYRTLASILKYDRQIPIRSEWTAVNKGYYIEDAPVVMDLKAAVVPGFQNDEDGEFKTIECSIMDIADDIAYSTYDLEDSFKAGFQTPLSILTSSPELLERVARKVSRSTGENFSRLDALAVLFGMFEPFFQVDATSVSQAEGTLDNSLAESLVKFQQSSAVANDSYTRVSLTSHLVGKYVAGVEVEVNERYPQLSKAKLGRNTLIEVECLKNYTFEAMIFSSRLKVAEYRGADVVSGLFDALSSARGHMLLPEDVRVLYSAAADDEAKRARVVSDYIAGMTDRYALEFYGRLHSDSPQSIFKPI